MLGMPNQTKESIVNTLKFLTDNHIIIRPTIYTPYHILGEDTDINQLSQYNRKTLKNNNVPGVTARQLLQLVKEPYDYEEILNLKDDKGKATIKRDDDAITPKQIAQLTKEKMTDKPGYISIRLQEIAQEFDKNLKEKEEK